MPKTSGVAPPPLNYGYPMIEIFTDGACSGNPGPGGWGVLIVIGEDESEHYGGEAATTNNRMEMMAVIKALEATDPKTPVRLFTDSQYVKNGITVWINSWKKNGWKTAARKPVKNKDLWTELDELVDGRAIEWRWVKGHSGHPGNERADALACRGVPSAH
ncbi:Ribonuclease HI [hydrothermal vent metagenome]|uniref:ribonuclease H n=1 Tax=hydrothermal vent metagenome TaxID=652676 RepID=A0A3B0SIK1_9ZZZZ